MTKINFSRCIQVTPEEEKQLEAFVKEHSDLIQKLRKPLEAHLHEGEQKGAHIGQQRKLVAPARIGYCCSLCPSLSRV